MGKNEIVKQLAERMYGNATDADVKRCMEFCDTLVDIFTDALLEDKKIVWKGFLSVEVSDRAAHKARNPQTNEIVTFPPFKAITCKVSKKIKDMVNGK